MNIKNSVHPADRLGALNAQIKDLTNEADECKSELKDMGVGKHEGQLFAATVSEVAESESYDAAAMEEKLRDLGVDDRWFKRHVKVKAGYLRVSVKDR